MQKLVCTIIIIVFTLIIINFTHCTSNKYSWIPSSKYPTKYHTITLPVEFDIDQWPSFTNYPLLTVSRHTPLYDLCSSFSLGSKNCSQLLCNDGRELTKKRLGEEESKLTAMMINYCMYCDNGAVETIECDEKSSKVLSTISNHDCLNGKSLYMEYDPKVCHDSNVTEGCVMMCMCFKSDRYGYQCDEYTSYLIPFKQWQMPLIVLGINGGLLMPLTLFLILFPRVKHTCCVRLCNPRCNITALFNIRMQGASLLFLYCLCIMAEQVVDVISYDYRFGTWTFRNYIFGWMRMLAISCILMTYSCMLVQWIHAVRRLKDADDNDNLSLFHKLIITVFYCSLVLSCIATALVAFLKDVRISYGVFACILCGYVLFFPVSLSDTICHTHYLTYLYRLDSLFMHSNYTMLLRLLQK
jgi:hypothetical protein